LNITLRKASALQSHITNCIERVVNTVEIDKFEDSKTKIDSASDKLDKIVNANAALYKALYNIRKLNQTAFFNVGINDILNDIAHLKKQRDMFSALVSNAEPKPTDQVINAKVEDLKVGSTSPNRFAAPPTTFTVSLFTKEKIDEMNGLVRDLAKKIRDLEDKLLDLNVKNEITLDDETVATLQAHKII
jgi:hypothetical protein